MPAGRTGAWRQPTASDSTVGRRVLGQVTLDAARSRSNGEMEMIAIVGLAGAAAANSAVPGPCILVTVTRAATRGIRSGLGVTLGILLSLVVLLAVAWSMVLGLSSLSGEAIEVLRVGGLLLLVGLALLMLRARPVAVRVDPAQRQRRLGDCAIGVAVGLSSPFNLLFIFALLPQFVDVPRLDATALVLATTAVLIGSTLPYLGACTFASALLRPSVRQAQFVTRGCGVALLGFAALAVVSVP